MRIRTALQLGIDKLQDISDTANIDSEILLLCATNRPNRESLYSDIDLHISPEQIKTFNLLIQRRLHGEPIAYIRGSQEFFGLDFDINSGVLIPRPDTEILVELAIKWLINSPSELHNIHAIDIGTGSGCIPISIINYFQENGIDLIEQLSIEAIDISENAISLAEKNADKLLSPSARHTVLFSQKNMLSWDSDTKYDLILSNPPYIPADEYTRLDRGVRDFEPDISLIAGKDGLIYYHQLLNILMASLLPDGTAFIEMHAELSSEIQNIFSKQFDTHIFHDLAQKPRVLQILHRD